MTWAPKSMFHLIMVHPHTKYDKQLSFPCWVIMHTTYCYGYVKLRPLINMHNSILHISSSICCHRTTLCHIWINSDFQLPSNWHLNIFTFDLVISLICMTWAKSIGFIYSLLLLSYTKYDKNLLFPFWVIMYTSVYSSITNTHKHTHTKVEYIGHIGTYEISNLLDLILTPKLQRF